MALTAFAYPDAVEFICHRWGKKRIWKHRRIFGHSFSDVLYCIISRFRGKWIQLNTLKLPATSCDMPMPMLWSRLSYLENKLICSPILACCTPMSMVHRGWIRRRIESCHCCLSSTVPPSCTLCIFLYSSSRAFCISKSSWRSFFNRCCSTSLTTPWCIACGMYQLVACWTWKQKNKDIQPSQLAGRDAQRKWYQSRRGTSQ